MIDLALAAGLVCLFYLYLDMHSRFDALLRYVRALEAKLAEDDE